MYKNLKVLIRHFLLQEEQDKYYFTFDANQFNKGDIEKVAPIVFQRALEKASNVDMLLNHDIRRKLSGAGDDTLKLGEDNRLIGERIEASKSYICNYAGQSIEQLEEHGDITSAVLVLIAEFYDNRTINVSDRLNLRMNMMLEGLLGRHSVNLL